LHNLKALIHLYADIVRDVPQDFSLDLFKESISSPIKVLEVHRLNRRVKVEGEFKYLPSRTICIKFVVQFLPHTLIFIIVGI